MLMKYSTRAAFLAFGLAIHSVPLSPVWAQSDDEAIKTVPTPRPKPKEATAGQEKVPKTKPEKAKAKPPRVYQSACPALLSGQVTGKMIKPVSKEICGERSPLLITSIGSVALSQPLTLNCRMATTLVTWLQEIDESASTIMDANIDKLFTSTSYQCRRRNNAPDGKISEHGFANAVDIVGFGFSDQRRVDLEGNWVLEDAANAEEEEPKQSKFLKSARDIACKHFTTVLGPEANALHSDHFHFDLGCHGRTCTYKICE